MMPRGAESCEVLEPLEENMLLEVCFAFTGDHVASLTVGSHQKVTQLKQELERPSQTPMAYQKLFLEGHDSLLCDHETLGVAGLKEGVKIMLVRVPADEWSLFEAICSLPEEGQVVSVLQYALTQPHPIDLNEPLDLFGNTPLIKAAEKGHAKVVKALITGGAETPNRDGDTPLIRAVANGHVKMVEALITGGANVEAPDRDGDTPLIRAIATGHVKMVEALIAPFQIKKRQIRRLQTLIRKR